MFGSRAEFALEFHVERDPGLLCVDIFVGGLHVNSWDNAFYPPLLVKKIKDELGRLADGATGYQFLEWGECTDEVLVFAEATGDRVHLDCRVHDGPRVAVDLSRTAFVETLRRSLEIAEREWATRLAAIKARN
ncbi:hypothetical protein [Lentzea sp. CC55]|uniref:hypothetical protein n=1 Tax=Lentzea sp. CC55 TaxID=2884909 RepID=UPI001F1EF1A8|nr:hypothetical protein [Lentzea sp. CC55]MCG8928026.1 hypothetical protein [Lentzea sp. CC55]